MNDLNLIVCRCEEVTLGKLMQTAAAHPSTARELKLRTRAGMGCCGGRTCRSLIDAIVLEANGQPFDHAVALRYQPPVRPVSFQMLGRS
ncbi:(2Fe-2S)-binding protein [Brevibacillus sp. TJ4]|uniref:(2Fe-2S)-binding protein n=1 Tax=Brevibacillus sp. TJ4 TaxID=3234853 RepID=UPI0037D5A22A